MRDQPRAKQFRPARYLGNLSMVGPPIQEDFAALTERCDTSLSLSPEDTASTYPLEEDLSTQFSTSLFGLSSETSLFLHRLFLGDPQPQSSNIVPVGATRSVIGSFDSPAVESSRSTLVISKPSRLNIRSVAFKAACDHVIHVFVDESTSPQKVVYGDFVRKCGLGVAKAHR